MISHPCKHCHENHDLAYQVGRDGCIQLHYFCPTSGRGVYLPMVKHLSIPVIVTRRAIRSLESLSPAGGVIAKPEHPEAAVRNPRPACAVAG